MNTAGGSIALALFIDPDFRQDDGGSHRQGMDDAAAPIGYSDSGRHLWGGSTMLGCTPARIRGRLRLFALLLFGLSAVSASAQLSEADRLARCANNRQAITALESRLTASWSRPQIAEARVGMDRFKAYYARGLVLKAKQGKTGQDYHELDWLSAQLEATSRAFNIPCVRQQGGCAPALIRRFESEIARSTAALPERDAGERQIAAHRSNLAALHCDELPSGTEAVVASVAERPAGGCNGFVGTWNTNYGPMWIQGNGSSITGAYEWTGSNGRRRDSFTGTVTGNVAEGTYSQPGYPNPDYQSGRFRFELHGSSFSGTGWSRSGGGGLAWNGTCASQ